MKDVFAKDIRENIKVDTHFLVKDKNLAVGKTGKSYLSVTIMDRTGELNGRVWDDADDFSSRFDIDDFVRVKGTAVSYMGKLQMKIHDIAKVNDGNVDLQDFLPVSRRDPDEMFAELEEIAGSLGDRYLRQMIQALIGDSEIAAGIRHAPAAKGMHHVYIGGLLEHTLSLCKLIDVVSSHYGREVNRDLLVAGAIIHDIGKTRELSYARAFGYTDEGRLLGHITIGVEMVEEKIRGVEGFPRELALLLKHMILSHHGVYEYGSPKRPKTLEATMLNYLDDLDAKVNSIQSLIEKDAENGSKWTSYHRMFDRYIYKGNCMLPEDDAADKSQVDAGSGDPPKGRTMTLF